MTTALVLEGGAYRAQFSAGVCDILLEHNIEVDVVYGVSAGALVGASYVSRQPGRTNRINLAFRDDSRFAGLSSLIKTGSVFGQEFLLDTVQNSIDPFDYDTFHASKTHLIAVATDVDKAAGIALEIKKLPEDAAALSATSALLTICQEVEINGSTYVDGGYSENIPVERALADGADRVVVVMTRPRSYVKDSDAVTPLVKRTYGNNQAFLDLLYWQPERYNLMRSQIFAQEKRGEVFVFCPEESNEVKLVRPSGESLLHSYIEGRRVATQKLGDLRAYLGKGDRS